MSIKDFRFWQKVKKSHDCWNYIGALNTSGYGWLTRDSKQIAAHRYSWNLHYGEIPKNKHVLHNCDNAACVNPSHLYLGTHSDNMIDRAKRRRCKTQKLSVTDVSSIRNLRAQGVTCQTISETFGISNGHVSAVATGKHYAFE